MTDTTDTPITRVDLDGSEREFLYLLETTSATRYYLRATKERGLEVLRARGDGRTMTSAHDNAWQRCTGIVSHGLDLTESPDPMTAPINPDDVVPMVLRVDAFHVYDYRVPGGLLDTTDYWWKQRPVTRIVRLDEMPPEGQRAKAEEYGDRP
ncbi:hypothetical protein [Demequina lutea]|uniref:Uncharacterized protein n=1 Tax=Demequina lutea TaxID=431489 RepID=A0A7Z0CIX5_9MICO|nr:hypothetical protein [Demequina lutea]NYI40140.1 hypothetical protein [Demequina lutea]